VKPVQDKCLCCLTTFLSRKCCVPLAVFQPEFLDQRQPVFANVQSDPAGLDFAISTRLETQAVQRRGRNELHRRLHLPEEFQVSDCSFCGSNCSILRTVNLTKKATRFDQVAH